MTGTASVTRPDVQVLLDCIGALGQQRDLLRDALTELVDLKDGPRDAAYEAKKPEAWRNARLALGRPGLDPRLTNAQSSRSKTRVTKAMLDVFFDALHEASMEIVYAEEPPSDVRAPTSYSEAGDDVLPVVRDALTRALVRKDE